MSAAHSALLARPPSLRSPRHTNEHNSPALSHYCRLGCASVEAVGAPGETAAQCASLRSLLDTLRKETVLLPKHGTGEQQILSSLSVLIGPEATAICVARRAAVPAPVGSAASRPLQPRASQPPRRLVLHSHFDAAETIDEIIRMAARGRP